MEENTPRVWVGCLACYNAGNLVGEWFDAVDADDATPDRIHNCTCERSETLTLHDQQCHYGVPHEELWVFDHENFHGLLTGECSPSHAKELAETLAEIPEGDREAFGIFVSNGYDASDFEESYAGLHDDEVSFAMQLADDMGFEQSNAWPASYIDWPAATRDLFMGDYWSHYSSDAGGYFIFRSV